MTSRNFNIDPVYYLRFWRLFLAAGIICLAASWVYVKYATPVYEASASIFIKADNKDEDTKNMPTLNLFGSKKIIENEIEVLKSRTVLTQVVKNLGLYAPISREGRIRSAPGYVLSPILIQLRSPDSLIERPNEKIYFQFNYTKTEVIIDSISYPLDRWINIGNRNMRFMVNPRYKPSPENELFSFSLTSVKKAVDNIIARLDIYAPNKIATVIDLKLEDESPERAEDVLNNIIKVYNAEDITHKISLAKNALSFLEERIGLVEKELQTVETTLQQYRTTKGVVDISEQGKLYLGNVERSDEGIGQINVQLSVLNQLENYINKKDQDAKIIPSMVGLNDPQLSQLVEKLYDREIESSRIKAIVPENNPMAITLRNEIERIRTNIRENVSNQKNNLQASRQGLRSSAGFYSSSLKTIPKKEKELLEISRQQAIKNNIYNFLLLKREEAILANASSVSDSRIVDYAQSSALPVKPKKQLIYLCAFILSMGGVGGCLYLKNLYKKTVSGKSDITENSEVPIIGEISHYSAGQSIALAGKTDEIANEQFRKLRTSLGYYGLSAEKSKILITSSISNEGKSFIASNLAASFAALNKKTLVIDLNFKNPTLHSIFNVPNAPGIFDLLSGKSSHEAVIQHAAPDSNVFLITSGEYVSNSFDRLLNNGFSGFLADMEKTFDHIIILASPLDDASDAYSLSKWCDITLYIIRQDRSLIKSIKEMNDSSSILKLTNSAIVFNDVKN